MFIYAQSETLSPSVYLLKNFQTDLDGAATLHGVLGSLDIRSLRHYRASSFLGSANLRSPGPR